MVDVLSEAAAVSLNNGVDFSPVLPIGARMYQVHSDLLDRGLATEAAQRAVIVILNLIDGTSDAQGRSVSPEVAVDRFCSVMVKSMEMGNSKIDPKRIFAPLDLRNHSISVQEMRLRVVEEAAFISLSEIFSPQPEKADLYTTTENGRKLLMAEKLIALIGERGKGNRMEFACAIFSAFTRLATSAEFRPSDPLTEAQGRFLSGIFDVYGRHGDDGNVRSLRGIAYFIEQTMVCCQGITIPNMRHSSQWGNEAFPETQPLSATEKLSLGAIKSLETLHDLMVLAPFRENLDVRNDHLAPERWCDPFITSLLCKDIARLYSIEYPARVVFRQHAGSRPSPSEHFWLSRSEGRFAPPQRG